MVEAVHASTAGEPVSAVGVGAPGPLDHLGGGIHEARIDRVVVLH